MAAVGTTAKVKTEPLRGGQFGAEIEGVDLGRPIDYELGQELRSLFFKHRILVFRNQEFASTQQIAFMSLISRVIAEPELPPMEAAAIPTADRYAWISSDAKMDLAGAQNNDQCFHSDHMFSPQGAIQAISLYGHVVDAPTPTVYANMVRAVELLPGDLRARVESLYVVNLLSFGPDFKANQRSRMSSRAPDAPNSSYPHSIHPIIERHPVTGEEYLDVSEMMTSHVVGWSDEASDELFEELAEVSYATGNLYRHQWQLHDFVVWDNISLQHRREPRAVAGERTLRRVLANPYELGSLYASAEMPEWKPSHRYDGMITTPASS